MTNERIRGIVKAVSPIKEHNGSLQIGWTLEANPQKWYNVLDDEESKLQLLLDKIIQKGNEVEFNFDNLGSEVSSLVRTQTARPKESTASNSNWQDDIVNFETLLTAAHKKKETFSIKTEMLAIDLKEKYALFKAQVIVGGCVKAKIGDLEIEPIVFEAHGDATDKNIKGELIKPHFIRMAETRAICRALRWYTNNGCVEEEKGGDKDPKEVSEPEQLGETESGVPTGASPGAKVKDSEAPY